MVNGWLSSQGFPRKMPIPVVFFTVMAQIYQERVRLTTLPAEPGPAAVAAAGKTCPRAAAPGVGAAAVAAAAA